MDVNEIYSALGTLENWLESKDFKGHDLHDALNSPLLKKIAGDNRLLGIVIVQFVKKLPFNLRPLLGTKTGYNPKGMGLFLWAYVKKYQITQQQEDLDHALFFANWLEKNYSVGYSGYCWGYNFDSPNRKFYTPKWTPTIVNTSFICHAFCDLFFCTDISRYLDVARSACDFILSDLNRTYSGDCFCFSYTPQDSSCVHNANMLGASLLGRVYSITKEKLLLDAAKQSMRSSVGKQRGNGSWPYGEASNQGWLDSFHTAYNLLALNWFMKYTGIDEYAQSLQSGYKFFIDTFLLDNGIVKYYHNKNWPLESHAYATAILCLCQLSSLDIRSSAILENVVARLIRDFMSPEGYFYYQRGRVVMNKIPYIRWVQAWVFLALTECLRWKTGEKSEMYLDRL